MGEAMKTTGLTLDQVVAAANACGLSFHGSETDGYLSAKYQPLYKSTKNGAKHYAPCACGFKAFRSALKNAGLSGWTFTVHKGTKVASWAGYAGITKIETSCKNAGFACAHPGAVSEPSVAPSITAEPAPVPEPKVPWDVLALAGAPLTDGTVTASDYMAIGQRRPVFAVTASLYVLEEMYVAAQALKVPTLSADVPDAQLATYHARIAWARKLVATRRTYGATLARNMVDYLAIASYSELCASSSGFGSRYTFKTHGDHGSGGTIRPECFRYDLRTLLPRMARAFRTVTSEHVSYGGKKWAAICDAAGLYFKFAGSPIAFVDHCVDLAHNGGLAFNKGYIIGNPRDQGAYMAMLDAKRAGSLLAGTAPIELTPEVAALLSAAVGCGIMAPPRCAITVTEDKTVPTIKWGTTEFVVYKGKHAPADSESDAAEPSAPTAPPKSWAIGGDGMATLAPAR